MKSQTHRSHLFSILILICFLCTWCAAVPAIEIGVFTNTRTQVDLDIAASSDFFLDDNLGLRFPQNSYELPSYRVCHILLRNLGPDQLDPHSILVGIVLNYDLDLEDPVEQVYNKPVSLAFWDNSATCDGEPSLYLRFYLEQFRTGLYAWLPPLDHWMKEYTRFMIVQEEDPHYDEWAGKYNEITGKRLNEWLPNV